jgi:benzoate/toluate 1,2-dioxygenase alpha subunit
MTTEIDRIKALVPEKENVAGRAMFTDEALFELEMKHIFEGGWIYVCHESQIAKPNDFFATHVGRQPVVINRDKAGNIGGFINACSHRGATVVREKRGSKSVFACPFHGWCFNSGGSLVKCGNDDGAYPAGFEKQKSLTKIRVESHKGFVFASLKQEVPPLAEYLNGAAFFLDLIADSAPKGIEILRGRGNYIYHGNWKHQQENGADGYHVATVHWNYLAVQTRRSSLDGGDNLTVMSPAGTSDRASGYYGFRNGHIVIWSTRGNPEAGPNHARAQEIRKACGDERGSWVLERSRNLGIYPNLFIMDSMSSHMRILRPISIDLTEVTTYCWAPVGESAESRALRIRQFEDFYNASGMATPDDLTEFAEVQDGSRATLAPWSDVSRGAHRWVNGPDAVAKAAGFDAEMSGSKVDDEGLYKTQHRAWRDRLAAALAGGQ